MLTPTGMAKPVADVQGENQAGFASDGSPVIGFSHLHDSGTGGVSGWNRQIIDKCDQRWKLTWSTGSFDGELPDICISILSK